MNRFVLRASSALCFFTAASALTPLAARAAEANGPGTSVGEVVVTAERRATDIQRTSVAVTAIDPATLDQNFTTNIAQLNGLVPSLQTTKAAGFENLVTIRGVGSGTPENSLTTSPGVSLFVDGVYIANTISLDQTLFDVGSIEVLRGPQGALYGQSSIGGAININTNQPKLKTWDASGDVSFGNYNLFRERAEVNIPLGDTLALRVSGQKFDHDGFTKNIYNGQDLDDAHDGSVKASLLWKPIDTFSITATAQLYHDNRNGDAQKNILDPNPDPRQLEQDLPGRFELTTQLYHINADWELPWFTIHSVSALQGLDHEQRLDSDRSIYSVIGGYDHIAAWNTHLHNYTQEIDFVSKPGRFEWVVGGFGLYQGSKQFVIEYGGVPGPNFSVSAPPTTYPPDILNNPPSYLNYGNLSYVKRRSYSFFGQGTFHVTNALSVTFGARYNHDYFRDDSINAGAGGAKVLPPVRYTTNTPTYRAVIAYDLTPTNNIYVSYNRGYKPGGVNGSNLTLIPYTFKPEVNDAAEIGSKNFLFDHTLRLNLAGFYYTHYNFQYIEPDVLPFNSGITNVPRIRDYGVEAEAQYVSRDSRLRIGGDIAIEKGTITSNYSSLELDDRGELVRITLRRLPRCVRDALPILRRLL